MASFPDHPSAVPPPKPTVDMGGPPNQDERTWGLLAHLSPIVLGFVGPLVVWVIKKDESAFVGDQAKEALNFQIAVMIAVCICVVTIVGWLLLPVVGVGNLVYSVLAAMEANKGVRYRYPYTIRLIQ
jgi:uncharacterized Tic20 family protein